MNLYLPIISRRRQRGSVVLALLILLAIMTLLAAANTKALLQLHQELNLLEHRQVVRLNAAQTNAVNTAVSPKPSPAK